MKKEGFASILIFLSILTLTYLASEISFSQRRETETVAETYSRAIESYRQDRIEESLRLISAGLEIDPESIALHNLAGWCHYRLNDPKRARVEFLISRGLEPTNPEALTGLGYLAISSGEDEEALDYFREALQTSPEDRDALVGYGICLHNSGHLDKARELFEYVLRTHAGDAEAKSWLDKCSPETARSASPEKGRYYSEPLGTNLLFRVEGDFFTIREKERFGPIFLKGVNLSATLPGGFPGDFNAKEEDYRFFVSEISELGANAVRVYTLQPPRFYKVLLEHNRENPQRPLYLLQGVWVEVPPGFDYFKRDYIDNFKNDIKETIDAVYGNLRLRKKTGRPEGLYSYDVHEYLCGLILGREWEPFTVVANDSINRNISSYEGQMVSVHSGTPTESWVAQILDFALSYEDSAYNWQHPLSFASWPTLDPLSHPTEIPLRAQFGQAVYNDDIVTLDISKIHPTRENSAGIFATYHVYPYHPDFMAVDPVYQHYRDELGRLDSYRAYLNELKGYYRGTPLLIAEYGVPASRGNAHPHPQRLSHGDHSEKEQGEVCAQLTNDIWQSGCAGAVAFELLDEWFKKTWITYGREIPQDHDPLWLNLQDPEENFGLLKVEPETKVVIDGRGDDWSAQPLMTDGTGEAKEGHDLKNLYVSSDEAYLYLRLDLQSESIDWEAAGLLVLISTHSDAKGEHRIKLKSGEIDLPFGVEFALYLKNPSEAFLLEDNGYSSRENDNQSDPNKDGEFVHIEHRVFREYPQGLQPPVYHDEGKLHYGDASTHPEQHPLIDWFSRGGTLEIRLPWALLKVSDPSSGLVLDYVGSSPKEWRTYQTEGLKFLCLSLKPSEKRKRGELWEKSRVIDALPDLERLKEAPSYLWETWKEPTYRIRRKVSFDGLAEAFASLPDYPKGTERLAHNLEWEYGPFDFKRLYDSSYDSKEEVLGRLEQVLRQTADPFARGDLKLIIERYRGRNPTISTAELFHAAAKQTDSQKRFLSLLAAYSIEKLYDPSQDLKSLLAASRSLSPRLADWIEKREFAAEIEIPQSRCSRRGRRVVIGASQILVPRGAVVKAQSERVVRDWLSLYNLDLPTWGLVASRIVPWHEGLRLKELLDYAEVRVEPVWFSPALKVADSWYAPDMEGNFRFSISPDKVYNYPTNKIIDQELVLINDTHGISALVWDTEGASLVVGCGDYPGKAEAAHYLAQRGINVYCPADRFIPLLLGTETPGKVLGSAPIRKSESGAVIGNQPVEIDLSERIVVSTTDKPYPAQYYDTPGRYFTKLERYLDEKLNLVEFSVDHEGGTVELIDFARRERASVVGIRVRTEREYEAVRDWLRERKENRAILFHSALYPEGYRLFFEFPEQTTFDDPYPVVK